MWNSPGESSGPCVGASISVSSALYSRWACRRSWLASHCPILQRKTCLFIYQAGLVTGLMLVKPKSVATMTGCGEEASDTMRWKSRKSPKTRNEMSVREAAQFNPRLLANNCLTTFPWPGTFAPALDSPDASTFLVLSASRSFPRHATSLDRLGHKRFEHKHTRLQLRVMHPLLAILHPGVV